MGDQTTTQAIVTSQTSLSDEQSVEKLALFNPDGTPFTGGSSVKPTGLEFAMQCPGIFLLEFGASAQWDGTDLENSQALGGSLCSGPCVVGAENPAVYSMDAFLRDIPPSDTNVNIQIAIFVTNQDGSESITLNGSISTNIGDTSANLNLDSTNLSVVDQTGSDLSLVETQVVSTDGGVFTTTMRCSAGWND